MTTSDEVTQTRPVQNLYALIGGRSASLIVLTGSEIGKMFRLEKPEVTVGRAVDADLRIEGEGISRHHLKMVRTETELRLVDLGSKNGVWCNGERVVGSRLVQDGDKIQLGVDTVLKLGFQDKLDEAAQLALSDAAVRDGLTGAFNKKFFTETLNKEFAYCERHDLMISLVALEVDDFNVLADTHGQAAGDFVLVNLVANFHAAIRIEDVLARHGGAQLVLVLREINADVSVAVAERLRRRVEGLELDFNGLKLKVTISAGVSTYVQKAYASADELVSASYEYLARAKAEGKNRVQSRWLAGR